MSRPQQKQINVPYAVIAIPFEEFEGHEFQEYDPSRILYAPTWTSILKGAMAHICDSATKALSPVFSHRLKKTSVRG